MKHSEHTQEILKYNLHTKTHRHTRKPQNKNHTPFLFIKMYMIVCTLNIFILQINVEM